MGFSSLREPASAAPGMELPRDRVRAWDWKMPASSCGFAILVMSHVQDSHQSACSAPPVQWSAWCHPRKQSQSGNRVAEHQLCWTRPSGDSDNQVEHKPTLTVLASTANHALGVVFRLDSKKVFTGRAVQPWDRPPERWGMSILRGFSRLSHVKPQPS